MEEETDIDDKQEYERFLSKVIGSKIENFGAKKKRKQRIVPFDQLFPGHPPPINVPFNQRRLMYLKQLLNRQVQHITTLPGPIPIVQRQEDFEKYQIIPDPNYNQIFNWIPGQTIFKARHLLYDYIPMIAQVHTGDKDENFKSPIYFKILQHLGRKHQNILATWDIFMDRKNQVIVFQEFPTQGDLGKLIGDHGGQPETMVQEWARQFYHALSYLGDMGICHNNLIPAYVTLHGRKMDVRLTGFYQSVVYWSVDHEKVIFFPCIPKPKQAQADFKALEVYGDGDTEQYDPIAADLWSYGAIIFYALCGRYPYDYEKIGPNLEEEIQTNVANLPVSTEAKTFLKEALTTQVLKRLTFDKVWRQSWIFK